MRSRRRYYHILGVPQDAPPAEVKRAYRDLAKRLHPDRMRNPETAREAEERLKEINAAWSEYCALRKRGEEGAGPARRARHGAGPARKQPARPPGDEGEEEWFSRAAAYGGARQRTGRSTRERYRAERARATLDREERERQARDQAEQVRRAREAEVFERKAYEREVIRGFLGWAVAGLAALVGVCLLLLVLFLLSPPFW